MSSSTRTRAALDVRLAQWKAADPVAFEAMAAKIAAQARRGAFEEGVHAERRRREELLSLKGASPEGDKAVEAAILNGQTFAEAAPVVAVAIIHGQGGENPPPIASAFPGSGSGLIANASDIAWYRAHGMSDEDIQSLQALEANAAASGRKDS